MEPNTFDRRAFVKSAGAVLALCAAPAGNVLGQTLSKRLDWDTFRTTDYYPAFVRGIAAMRDNTDARDRRSWQFWTDTHLNFCPHGSAQCLAWYRGYLYYFEQYLRFVSGNKALMIPYWNYYRNPVLPAEFTDPSPTNPLYVERLNTNVSQALTLAPFAPVAPNFERNTVNAFEPSVERKLKNSVNDIIGGVMATMRSPQDPIFWLHQANIDRLWVAWIAAGNGRRMPAPDSAYWDGQFDYGLGLSMRRNLTYSTRDQMAYFYENELLPTTLPPAVPRTSLANAPRTRQSFVTRPPEAVPEASLQRTGTDNQLTAVDLKNLRLDEKSITVRIPVGEPYRQKLQTIVDAGDVAVSAAAIEILLDNVRLTAVGARGGYYYNLYLNMPARASSDLLEERYFLGSLGAFAIACALRQAGQRGDQGRESGSVTAGGVLLSYPAAAVLAGFSREERRQLTMSFIRIGGDKAPAREVITIGEVRIAVAATGVH